MLNFPSPVLQQFIENTSRDALREKLNAMASSMGDKAFAARMAREVVARTQPERTIPEVYARYRCVVRDGVEFFLSQVGRQRLVELALDQLQLPADTDTAKRLLEMAKRFATLHKLGQVIARNPNIDARVKKWLIHLENGDYGTPHEGIMEKIGRQLAINGHRRRVQLSPSLLSEASVGAAIRFNWHPPASKERVQGIFKVLKPAIRRQLKEELDILEKTAAFFENHRSRYPFKDFRFLDVFEEVRHMLINEIDLAAEQVYLAEAAEFFADMPEVQVPKLLPLSTAEMTAMAYLPGPKITDTALNAMQRERLADALFQALVCRPLFSRQEASLFHGDPHAGNILAVPDPETGRLRVGLLDWTLAGHLTRSDRLKTAHLIQAVIKKDLSSVRRGIKDLAIGDSWDDPARQKTFRRLALDIMHSSAYAGLTQLEKTFKLLEELAYAGFVFPADLMLFRKTIFTLEGVLYDLCPAFDMDAAVTRYLAGLITEEIPGRIANLLFPLADRPENYPSLISNNQLQSLLVHQYVDAVGKSYRSFARIYWGWGRLFADPAG